VDFARPAGFALIVLSKNKAGSPKTKLALQKQNRLSKNKTGPDFSGPIG
jgi:hypothetical protein